VSHANGKIPPSDLSTVAIGVQLVTPAANAYRALVAQAAHEHVSIKPAGGVGSGYRDIPLQELFYRASHGDRAAIAQTHLNPDDRTPIAAPGGSSHGWGDRIDLLFDGSAHPSSVDLNLAKRYGFVREFGSADPNHFEHDGKTAVHPPVASHPAGAVFVTVKEGDTVSEIAEAHRLTLHYVLGLNADQPWHSHPDVIHPGDKVRIK
jgi:hypothetical protein